MNDRPQLDPRYDPAFQRGYTGEVETAQHPHGVLKAAKPTRIPEADEVTPVPGVRVPAAPRPDDSEVGSDVAVAPTGADAGELVDEADDTDAEPSLERKMLRNPYLFVLALLGAALIVAGSSWALSGRASMTTSGSLASERDFWYVQAALVGAPLMIVAGVGIIAGVLFMFAHAWNRGR